MSGPRLEWLFGAGAVGLLLVAVGVLPLPEADGQGDSFGEDAGGKRAYYLLASELLSDVRRNSGSLLPDDESADILLILGPARYPDRAQWQTLHDWVSRGRGLVFAARWHDPAVRLEPFGIEIAPLGAGLFEGDTASEPAGEEESEGPSDDGDNDNENDDENDKDEDEDEDEAENEDVEPAIVSTLSTSNVDWRSSGHIRSTSDEADVYLYQHGMPQIVWQPVGDGVIVVVASDFLFTNRSLTHEENGLLAFRVLETASPAGPVYFDESLNEAGAPKVVGILLEPPFRLQTLQLLLVVLLLGWAASRRFGPVRTEEKAARRSLVEHAEALGSLHFRVGTTAALLSSYLEFFRKELGLSHRGAAGLEPESSTQPSSVRRALRAAKSPNSSPSQTAGLIRELARTRHDNQRS